MLQGAGKKPKWNQSFDIDVKYIGDDISFVVYDEDVTSSDEVGRTTQKLSALCIAGGIDEWFQVQYKGRKSGMLHLKGNFKPASSAAFSGAVAGAAAKNVMGGLTNMYGQPAQPMAPMGMYGAAQPQMYGVAAPVPMMGNPMTVPAGYGMPQPMMQ